MTETRPSRGAAPVSTPSSATAPPASRSLPNDGRAVAQRLIAGSSETGCYQINQLRKTLSVTSGTHFTPAQRSAAQDALGAVLKTGECRNAPPIAPTTVPHIFSRKNERMQFTVQFVGRRRISLTVDAPPQAKVVALNVPKKKVKGKLRVTVVARRLLDGGATPATVTVR